jgi:hypothetical protein
VGNATTGNALENNTTRIGSAATTAFFATGIFGVTTTGGTAVSINANGLLGTSTSSIRFKEEVTPLDSQTSQKVYDLNTVRFKYKNGDGAFRYGLIAEEVEQVYPEIVVKEADGETPYTVNYVELIPFLLKEIQTLNARVAALETPSP